MIAAESMAAVNRSMAEDRIGDDGFGVTAAPPRDVRDRRRGSSPPPPTAMSRLRYSSAQSRSVTGRNAIPACSAYLPATLSPCTVTPRLEGGEYGRQQALGSVVVYQQRLGRVAHTHAVRLGIDHNLHRTVQRGILMQVDVTVAHSGLDHRDERLDFTTFWMSPASAGMTTSTMPRARPRHRRCHGRDPGTSPDRVDRHVGVSERCPHGVHEHRIAVSRARRASQQRRVVALEAQDGCIHCHVRARLVDHADHTQRNPDLAAP